MAGTCSIRPFPLKLRLRSLILDKPPIFSLTRAIQQRRYEDLIWFTGRCSRTDGMEQDSGYFLSTFLTFGIYALYLCDVSLLRASFYVGNPAIHHIASWNRSRRERTMCDPESGRWFAQTASSLPSPATAQGRCTSSMQHPFSGRSGHIYMLSDLQFLHLQYKTMSEPGAVHP
jgi:hypothetical protein